MLPGGGGGLYVYPTCRIDLVIYKVRCNGLAENG